MKNNKKKEEKNKKSFNILSKKSCASLILAGIMIASPLMFAGCSGEKGDTGAYGKNAYELAVESGFQGTLSEWLESLIGKSGTPVEFRATETHIQWRYVGDNDWNDLVAFEDLKEKDLEIDKEAINQRGIALFQSKLDEIKTVGQGPTSSYKIVYDYINYQEVVYVGDVCLTDYSLYNKSKDSQHPTAGEFIHYAIECGKSSESTLDDGTKYVPYELKLYALPNCGWKAQKFLSFKLNQYGKDKFEIVDGKIEKSSSFAGYGDLVYKHAIVQNLNGFKNSEVYECVFNDNGDCKITLSNNRSGLSLFCDESCLYEFSITKEGYIKQCDIYKRDFLNKNIKGDLYCRVSYIAGAFKLVDYISTLTDYVKVEEYASADRATIFGYEYKGN